MDRGERLCAMPGIKIGYRGWGQRANVLREREQDKINRAAVPGLYYRQAINGT